MGVEELIAKGCKIENAKIENVDLSMRDHRILTLKMVIKGNGWDCCYGGYDLGHGYLGARDFKGSVKGTEYIMQLMDTVGVDEFSALKGKCIRIASATNWGKTLKIIGNIIQDKWFDPENLFNLNIPGSACGKLPWEV